jgi:hypothetical protein
MQEASGNINVCIEAKFDYMGMQVVNYREVLEMGT